MPLVPDAYSPLEQLLRALRRPTVEVQLTQAIAAFAHTDPGFAARFVEVIVQAAPDDRRAALGPVPAALRCDAELVLAGGRRVDLRFEDEHRSFGLLVELKIDAGYGHAQLDDYLQAADALRYERVGLIAITKSPQWYGEDSVSADTRWLGSVRWAAIYERLDRLEHAELAEAWRGFLRVVKDQGDFGVVSVDADAVKAWARYQEGANTLRALMEELAPPALEVVRASLTAAGVRGDAVMLRRRVSPVYSWNDRIHLRLAVPAGAKPEERLRIQFFAFNGKVHFCVEARYPDARPLLSGSNADDRLAKATRSLEGLNPPFRSGHDWESYWSRWHVMDALLEQGTNPSEQLLVWLREDVDDLVRMNLFGLLQGIAESRPRPVTPPHDE